MNSFFYESKMTSKRFLYWGAQLAGWLFYSLLVLLSSYSENPESVNKILYQDILLFIIISILVTHTMRVIFIKIGWLELKLKPLIPRIIISSFIFSFLIIFITRGIENILNLDNNETFSMLKIFNATLSISVLLFFWNALYFTFHFFTKSRNQEISNLALLASKNEFELNNLKTQLNPHFLFNSLNSIRALVEIEPQKAKTSITALSNLLRKSLQVGKINLISLEQEMDIVKNYLKLEKIRFEERLEFDVNISNNCLAILIPPFCIQMLVENAIKHGISNLVEGGEILIACTEKENTITISVKNSGKIATKTDLGVGLQNLKRRLAIQFNGEADYTLKEEGEYVISTITLKRRL
jgi:two-component system, LytTR family, sensor kinase